MPARRLWPLRVAGHARDAGVRVAWGACREGDGGAPYAPWLTVVHALGRSASDLGDLSSDGGQAGRFRPFADVTTIVRDTATAAGLLIVLDDLHWADTGSLLLLQSLARGIDDAPVVVLGLLRDQGIGAEQGALLRAIGRERIARAMSLAGLSAPDAAALAEAAVGHPLPDAVTAAIVERSGGSPLFVRELARLADAPGTVDALSSACAGSSASASPSCPAWRQGCCGTPRSSAVTSRPCLWPRSAVAILPRSSMALTPLRRPGLVSVDGHVVRFAHVLTQEVLYAELPRADRHRLHARAAEALSSSSAIDALAYHLHQAAPLCGAEPAVRATLEAGRQADRQLAYEQAADQFRAALGLMGDARNAERAGVLLELARCEVRSGTVDQAWRTCQAAAGIGCAIAAPHIVAYARPRIQSGRRK